MNKLTQLENNELSQIAKYSGPCTKFMTTAFYQYVEFANKKTENLTKILDLDITFSDHPSTFNNVRYAHLHHDLLLEKSHELNYFDFTQEKFDKQWDAYITSLNRIINEIKERFNIVPKTLVLYTLACPRIIMSSNTFVEEMIFGSLFWFKDSDGNFIDML